MERRGYGAARKPVSTCSPPPGISTQLAPATLTPAQKKVFADPKGKTA